jgi:hypothetical protein
MRLYTISRRGTIPARQQFPENFETGRLAVMRATHATSTRIFPSAAAFVVAPDGLGAARIRSRFDVAGQGRRAA